MENKIKLEFTQKEIDQLVSILQKGIIQLRHTELRMKKEITEEYIEAVKKDILFISNILNNVDKQGFYSIYPSEFSKINLSGFDEDINKSIKDGHKILIKLGGEK